MMIFTKLEKLVRDLIIRAIPNVVNITSIIIQIWTYLGTIIT